MAIDLVQTLSDLVAIPSVNPMGRPLDGPEFYEERVTDYLQRLFERLGLPWQRQLVQPRRENIVARLNGDRSPESGGPLILLEAHQDTVPVDGMTIDPWKPQVRDGRLYGRGACDIKGGMTAMLGALSRLADKRPPGMPTVIMACTVNEEYGYSGASELPKLWATGSRSVIPRRPDAAIVAEPTDLDVVVAHKGAVRWKCRTHGLAAHSSQPDRGKNAIYGMAPVLEALERYAGELGKIVSEHPLCGRATLSVGTIQGGLSVNTVPDVCTIEIDRRLLPGEEGLAAYEHVLAYLRETATKVEVEHQHPYLLSTPLADRDNGALAERLVAVLRRVLGRGEKIGVSFGTNASRISVANVPTVVFGPGSIDQAHTADEWLSIDELTKAADVLYEFLANAGG